MKRKYFSLTLLEVVLSTILLGILLSVLFQIFYTHLRTQTSHKKIHTQAVQTCVFEHNMKTYLLQAKKIWIAPYEDSAFPGVFLLFSSEQDPDPDYCKDLKGVLFVNSQQELCWREWSQKNTSRDTCFMENVRCIHPHLFDPEKAEWKELSQTAQVQSPILEIIVETPTHTVPFTFFTHSASQPIPYKKTL